MTVIKNIFSPVLQSYSPKNVIITAGVFLITQWNKVTVKYDEPVWKFDVGCYGKIVRRKINNPLGTITIELPQTAAGNAYNSASATLTDATLGIDGVIPILITDLWGGSLHVMTKGSIVQKPEVTYDKNPTNRVWIFRGEMDLNVLSTRNAINSFSSMFR